MIRCLIVDDSPLARLAIRNYAEQLDFLNIVGACESATEAIELMQATKVDLLFLAMELPQMDGLELLRNLPEKPLVILLAFKADYAVAAFELEVFDYLIKPVKMARFLKAVHRAKEYLEQPKQNKISYLFLRIDNILTRIDLEDILYIKAMSDYIHITTHQKKYLTHTTLKSILEKLPDDRFIQIHRSYIAALNKIDHLQDNKVVINGEALPVGETQRNNLLSKLNTHL